MAHGRDSALVNPRHTAAHTGRESLIRREVIMLDLFYIAIAIAFFGLLWAFTKASERL